VDTITILDHHKTAAEQLVDLPANVHVVFDMERSGAVMAWEFFHPRTPVPRLIKHVQDRDLWRFDLEGTREIMACVLSHPYEFETWFRLLDTDPAELRAGGVAIRRNHDKQVAALVRDGVHATTIAGHRVPAVNAPGFFASDVGDIIGCGQPFAAVYSDDGEYRKYSLRSDADGLDVSKIAGFFGGGGHKHAAGFQVLLRAVGQIGDIQTSLYPGDV
jgi:oligoribonuclease NrnB/cAMP/cGMP phosphodiesterase (DHH superfamily)